MRIHHSDHWRSLAKFASEFLRALANVIVDAVHADAAILAHVVLAIVDVFRTISASIAGSTLARIMREVVDAFGVVVARIEFGAVRNLQFTVFAREARLTFARVRFDAVDAGRIILTLVLGTIIDVHFAPSASVARHAIAIEASLLQDCASRVVSAWIAVAGVNHEFTVLSVETGLASALVLSFGLRHTHRFILAWESEASITFRQNLVADFGFAHEIVGWRR